MRHSTFPLTLLWIGGLSMISCNNTDRYGKYGTFNPKADFFTNSTFIPRGSLKSNPAHGKPGHRCDLPEGAPLYNAKSNTTFIQQPGNFSGVLENNINTQPSALEQNTTQSLNPTLNPDHGLPGHRCDLAVGSPLNAENAPPSTSVETTTTTPSAKTPNGSNPPHGQPGHQCVVIESSSTTQQLPPKTKTLSIKAKQDSSSYLQPSNTLKQVSIQIQDSTGNEN